MFIICGCHQPAEQPEELQRFLHQRKKRRQHLPRRFVMKTASNCCSCIFLLWIGVMTMIIEPAPCLVPISRGCSAAGKRQQKSATTCIVDDERAQPGLTSLFSMTEDNKSLDSSSSSEPEMPSLGVPQDLLIDDFLEEIPRKNGNSVFLLDRFHTDMVRALESRKRNAMEYLEKDKEQRRHRPLILGSDVDGAERVEKMLQHLVDIGIATQESFAICCKAFLQRGRTRWKQTPKKETQDPPTIICAADQLELLLQQMEQHCDDIDTATYNIILEGYATCATPRGDRNYAKRADKLLERMQLEGKADFTSLVHVLHAWAWQQTNLKPGNCARRAHELLEQIKSEYENPSQEDLLTLLQCHDWVLEAFSKSAESPHEAQEVFDQMQQLSSTLPTEVATLPNSQSYSNIILAWSKCNSVPGTTQRAHDLLQEAIDKYQNGTLEEPELIAFNGVITGWARMGRPEEAQDLLWQLDKLTKSCSSLVPDKLTYNAVLHSHVRNPKNKLKAVDKAVKLVKHMETNCRDHPAIRPDSFTYNTLMKAWVQSGRRDAAQKTEEILLKMEQLSRQGDREVTPNIRNYNVVINAYSKNIRDRSASRKAHGILKRMQSSSTLQPDIISFTSVMECLSKSSEPDASLIALELLEQAQELYKETGDESQMPNLRTYTMAILALAKCPPRLGNVEKARELLRRLNDEYNSTGNEALKPNEFPYNYVLNCAANAIGSQQDKIAAFKAATQTYQEMRKCPHLTPDSFTYAFWIKACNNLLPAKSDLHTKCVSLAFEQCKQEGLVTNEVLNRLQSGATPDMIRSLLKMGEQTGYRHVRVHDLPQEWSRKTRKRRN